MMCDTTTVLTNCLIVIGTFAFCGCLALFFYVTAIRLIKWGFDYIGIPEQEPQNPPTPPKKPKKNKQSTPELLEYGAYTRSGGVVRKVPKEDN